MPVYPIDQYGAVPDGLTNNAVAIQLRDEGNVSNVLFSDCTIETHQFHPKWWGNARFRGENGIFLCGCTQSPLKDITLDGVRGSIRKTSKFPVDFFDIRPSNGEEHGGLEREKLEPITVRHVEGLEMLNTNVSPDGDDLSHWELEEEGL
jgi:hypothetical protein